MTNAKCQSEVSDTDEEQLHQNDSVRKKHAGFRDRKVLNNFHQPYFIRLINLRNFKVAYYIFCVHVHSIHLKAYFSKVFFRMCELFLTRIYKYFENI